MYCYACWTLLANHPTFRRIDPRINPYYSNENSNTLELNIPQLNNKLALI